MPVRKVRFGLELTNWATKSHGATEPSNVSNTSGGYYRFQLLNGNARIAMPNFEPALALNRGSDGLDKILGLCTRIRDKLRKHPTSRFMPKFHAEVC